MLTLTPKAADEIRNIVNQPEVPQGCGVRIANEGTSGELSMGLAAVPAEEDTVLDDAGARLFLDPQAAAVLDDKMLDVTADTEGRVQFAIAPQPG